MNKIIEAKFIGPDIKQFRIEAPKIAEKQKAGQFIILRVTQNGERIPLTIAGSDRPRERLLLSYKELVQQPKR